MSIFSNSPSAVAPSLWERIVQRKEESADLETRRSIFLGTDADTGVPVCVPRGTLDSSHFHVLGMTRAGKTAATLMPIVFQILRGYRDESGKPAAKSPVIIFDLKGDQAFFNATRAAALKAGQRFRFLSTRQGDDYHFFDPFQMFQLGRMLPVQLAAEFVRAFSLDYGLIYGGLYYTQQNLVVLVQAIEDMLARPQTPPTIEHLSRILQRLAKSAHNADARHVESCLQLLARYPQVNIAKNQASTNQRIDLLRALDECEVIYFFMEMEDQAPSLRQVASLALYTLVQAAKYRYRQGLPQRHTYVVIDEFYHIAGKSFGELLSTVADWGLHMILANQSRRQLENHDSALPDIIAANTGVVQALTFQAEDEENFRLAAGETRQLLRSISLNERGESAGVNEALTSFLTDAELKRVNDTKLSSLVLIQNGKARSAGRRVQKVQGLFPLHEEVYQRYRRTPLPQRPADLPESRKVHSPAMPSVPVVPTVAPSVPLGPTPRAPVLNSAAVELTGRMQRKWQDLVNAERTAE